MTLKTNMLRDAINFALAVGATAVIGTGIASAQTAPAATPAEQEATTLDRIQVTGSRIRQVDLETAQPVLTITRADIEKQGFQSVADILQNITATGTPPLSRASPLSAGELAGGTYISLRNLGAQRTLVLVNGKRLGISTSGFSDVSTIPAVAVERIEVLKDGASSIYGSDAIAGVINVITRSNFEGASASAYYGQYDQGDGSITKGDFIMGFTGDRGSLTAAAEWGKEDVVRSADRPFSAFPRSDRHPDDQWTAAGQFGGFATCARGTAAVAPTCFVPGLPAGRWILREGGDPTNRADYRAQNTSTTSPADKSNTNLQTDLRTPLERKSLYVDGIFDITDNVRFRTNLLYSNRVTDRQVAGYPMQSASFPQTAPGLSIDSYYNPYGNAHNPAAPQALVGWWRRSWEVPRVSSSELTTYRFSGALEGSFEWADRYFDWDVGYLKNSNKLVQANFGNLHLPRLAAGTGPSFLNSAGRVQCGTAAAPISFGLCVPFNPFLEFGREGDGGLTNNTELQNWLFQEEHVTGQTDTTVIAANLAGQLATLPAGDLGFAVGVENRKEDGGFTPDALSVTGDSTNLASRPTFGGYTVNELYAELQIPILADVPFAQELSLSLASRYSDYDSSGSSSGEPLNFGDTVNSKFGFKWKPIDSVLVRGTWAEGFRAPTIADLYGGGSQTFSFITDPCDTSHGAAASNPTVLARCNAAGTPAGFRQLGQGFVPSGPNAQTPVGFFGGGGNPALTPETSVSKTLGVVWSPEFVEGLNLALDWWNIRIENTIVTDAPTTMLNDCYVQNIAARCATHAREAGTGMINDLTFGNRNAGYRDVEGYDFDVAYRYATDNWGAFSAVSNTTYTSKDYFVSTNDPRVPISTVGFTSSFRIRSNLNLGWQSGAWGVNWMARYYSSMKETCTYLTECTDPDRFAPTGLAGQSSLQRVNRNGSNTFNDVQVRWEAPWNATVAVGANNVFERYGPVMYTQPSANVSYYGGFDIGRFLYMQYTQRF